VATKTTVSTMVDVPTEGVASVGVLGGLRAINEQAARVRARQAELASASRSDLDRIAAIKTEKLKAETAAVRSGEEFDSAKFDVETEALRAQIAGRDGQASKRALSELRGERRALIDTHRDELLDIARRRVTEADGALHVLLAAVSELERAVGKLRGAAGLAFEGLDQGGGGRPDALVLDLYRDARPWLSTPRRAIGLDASGLRTTTDLVGDVRRLLDVAWHEVDARPTPQVSNALGTSAGGAE
jgi:hypothetical protein